METKLAILGSHAYRHPHTNLAGNSYTKMTVVHYSIPGSVDHYVRNGNSWRLPIVEPVMLFNVPANALELPVSKYCEVLRDKPLRSISCHACAQHHVHIYWGFWVRKWWAE